MAKLTRTEQEWKEMLDPEQYNVCRLSATERPFTGKYNDFKGDGIFICVACDEPLFDSSTKFDSGCGWPSFYEPYSDEAIRYLEDDSHGMQRVEIRCGSCDAHLGHVFPDGPQPTGERFCVNSASLSFTDEDGNSTQG